MLFRISCAPAAAGACCCTISHYCRRSTPNSAAGNGKVCGPGSATRRRWRIVNVSAARSGQARRSLIAGRFAPQIKGGSKGYDAAKKISGRKRHILTDTDVRMLAVDVHGVDIQDRDGGKGVLKLSRARFPFMQRLYADRGYGGRLVDWAKDKTHRPEDHSS